MAPAPGRRFRRPQSRFLPTRNGSVVIWRIGSEDRQARDKVSHPVFGKGTVVSVSKTAGDTVVTVAFDGQGIKRLALSFAPLSKA